MAEVPEPEATGSKARTWVVIGIVVAIIGYLIANSIHKNAIIAGLASKDPAVRKSCGQWLIENKLLTDILSRQLWETKVGMIQTLEEINTPESADELVALMKDRNTTIQNKAQFALCHMGKTAIPKLVEGLKNSDLNIKTRSAMALISDGLVVLEPTEKTVEPAKDEKGNPKGEPTKTISVTLLDAVGDGAARGGVVRVLTTFVTSAGGPAQQQAVRGKVVPWLLKKVDDKDATADAKSGSIEILGRIQAQEAVGDIRKTLDDPKVDGGVRKAALVALGRLKHADAYGLLEKALAEEDLAMKSTAMMGLGELADPRAVPLLKPYLSGYNEALRDSAVASLSRIGPAAIPALVEQLGAPAVEVRLGSVRALEGIEDARVAGILATAMSPARERDATVRRRAAEALAKPGMAAAAAPLLTALRDGESTVALQAEKSLVVVGAPAVPGLIQALSGAEDAPSALYAQDALRRIGPQAVAALIQTATGAGSKLQRQRAILTLGEIGDPRAAPVLEQLVKASGELRPVAERALKQLSEDQARVG